MQKRPHDYKIILGSASPRRKFLMELLFGAIEIKIKKCDERYSTRLKDIDIAKSLAAKKMRSLATAGKAKEIILTADTMVVFNGRILNKPKGFSEALKMLELLNGKTHKVITGVCISSQSAVRSFATESFVTFYKKTEAELRQYIQEKKPFDKAGAYGAQECLPGGKIKLSRSEINLLKKLEKLETFSGYVFENSADSFPLIKKIDGSFTNVMGLPVVEVYNAIGQLKKLESSGSM